MTPPGPKGYCRPVTVTHDGALLSCRWLNPRLPMGSGEWIPCFLCLHVRLLLYLLSYLDLNPGVFSLLSFRFSPPSHGGNAALEQVYFWRHPNPYRRHSTARGGGKLPALSHGRAGNRAREGPKARRLLLARQGGKPKLAAPGAGGAWSGVRGQRCPCGALRLGVPPRNH